MSNHFYYYYYTMTITKNELRKRNKERKIPIQTSHFLFIFFYLYIFIMISENIFDPKWVRKIVLHGFSPVILYVTVLVCSVHSKTDEY